MKPDMEAVKQFYAKQNEWAGVYSGDVTEAHRKNAAIVHRLAGGRIGRLLDLGAGGGQNAAAAADLAPTAGRATKNSNTFEMAPRTI